MGKCQAIGVRPSRPSPKSSLETQTEKSNSRHSKFSNRQMPNGTTTAVQDYQIPTIYLVEAGPSRKLLKAAGLQIRVRCNAKELDPPVARARSCVTQQFYSNAHPQAAR